MAELIQVIREHPQLKTQIQDIVQRKDLLEPANMAADPAHHARGA